MGSFSLFQGIFPTQGSNPGLPHCRWILYQLSHKESPAYLSGRSVLPRNHGIFASCHDCSMLPRPMTISQLLFSPQILNLLILPILPISWRKSHESEDNPTLTPTTKLVPSPVPFLLGELPLSAPLPDQPLHLIPCSHYVPLSTLSYDLPLLLHQCLRSLLYHF